MNILVCISHVPDTTTKIQFDGGGKTLNKTGVSFVINPYDDYALSKAIDLKEKNKAGKIVAICVGSAEVEPTLRKALATGADEAVRIDAEPLDAYYVAKQIAEYARDKGFEVILCGKESIDSNAATTPGMIAELLDLPCVTFASFFDVENGKGIAQREADAGVEVIETSLPVVITSQKGISEWKIPNMRGIMAAKTKPLKVEKPVEATPHYQNVKYELPPAKQGCVYIDPKNTSQLVEILSQKGAL